MLCLQHFVCSYILSAYVCLLLFAFLLFTSILPSSSLQSFLFHSIIFLGTDERNKQKNKEENTLRDKLNVCLSISGAGKAVGKDPAEGSGLFRLQACMRNNIFSGANSFPIEQTLFDKGFLKIIIIIK